MLRQTFLAENTMPRPQTTEVWQVTHRSPVFTRVECGEGDTPSLRDTLKNQYNHSTVLSLRHFL